MDIPWLVRASGAGGGGTVSGDLSAMLAYNFPANAQFHAGAASAGWPNEIRLEDGRQVVWRDGSAVIVDFYQHQVSRPGFGLDADSAPGRRRRQLPDAGCPTGIPRQQQQIDPQVFKLARVSEHFGQVFLQLAFQCAAGFFELRTYQRQRILDGLVDR